MSLAFLDLRETFDKELTREYFRQHRETEESRTEEIGAVGSIQRLWRGYVARKYIAFLHSEATRIKQTWRAYQGRLRAKEVKRQRVLTAETGFFNAMATIIQKLWRGYFSRKRKQDFYARKAYLSHVTLTSNQVQRDIDESLQREFEVRTIEHQRREAQEFTNLSENLHHLLGTKHIHGVFNSPYGNEFSATAFGVPMEKHIKDSFEAKRKRDKAETKDRRRMARPPPLGSPTGSGKESPMNYERPKARGKGRALGLPTPNILSSDQPDYQPLARTQQGRYRVQRPG